MALEQSGEKHSGWGTSHERLPFPYGALVFWYPDHGIPAVGLPSRLVRVSPPEDRSVIVLCCCLVDIWNLAQPACYSLLPQPPCALPMCNFA